MTTHVKVYNIPPRIQYLADGTNTVFEFPFLIFESANLKVYFSDILQSDTTYTVNGVNESGGGFVTFKTAPSAGTVITLTRELAIERTTDFQDNLAIRPAMLNQELDFQIACQQQIADNLNRSMVLPPYAVSGNVNLTLPLPQAGKAIVWNADGTNLENSTVAVNALESTLNGYKTAAENASLTAIEKAGEATNQATNATAQANTAAEKATEAATAAQTAVDAMADKANINMDNLSNFGQEKMANCAMPSDKYVDLTLAASGSSYTAPADGYMYFKGSASAGGQYGQLSIPNSVVLNGFAHNANADVYISIPVPKGANVVLTYTTTSNNRLRFIYAIGSKGE